MLLIEKFMGDEWKSYNSNPYPSPALVNSQLFERPTPVLVRRRGLVF